MLKKFSVENFKSFEGKFVFDLSNPGNYEFSSECIRNNIVSKGAIYGINGIGKSNLGLALFDIVNNLTDKNKRLEKYNPFLNLNSKKQYASFEYEFMFDNKVLIYSYQKKDVNTFLVESLKIDGKEMIFYDFRERTGFSRFKGSEHISLDDGSSLSRVKYIMSTSILDDADENNLIFKQFKTFVSKMLLFYSLKENSFIGFKEKSDYIENIIINEGKLADFQNLLNKHGLKLELIPQETMEGKRMYIKYSNGSSYFFSVASTGMSSLALYFSWLIFLSQCSFVFIDEFDAFYHYELAEDIIKELKKNSDTQIFVTTHNTDLLSNELLRPDTYYVLTSEKIDSLNHLTEKDLRFAHNLQKMFKANAFNN